MRANRIGRQLGISLIESLTTVAIAGVLLGTGVPSFTSLIAENRITTEVNAFIAHVHLARNQAVTRGIPSILCPSTDGQTCLRDPRWHRGYMLFIDGNDNRTRDADEPLIRRVQGEADNPVAITSSRARRMVRFQSDGSAGGNNLTITFCETDDNAAARAVIVSNVGRPRVTNKTASGDPLSCG